jgi:hypothetical protein
VARESHIGILTILASLYGGRDKIARHFLTAP